MTRKKLTEAIAGATREYGFAFQTGAAYRIAPELKRLPAAWLHPPRCEKTEGRNEGFVTYSVKLELMEAYEAGRGTAEDERWAGLEEKASAICRRLGQGEGIQVVSGMEFLPAELSLTAQGEQSLGVQFKVRMPFCKYCDCGDQ